MWPLNSGNVYSLKKIIESNLHAYVRHRQCRNWTCLGMSNNTIWLTHACRNGKSADFTPTISLQIHLIYTPLIQELMQVFLVLACSGHVYICWISLYLTVTDYYCYCHCSMLLWHWCNIRYFIILFSHSNFH